MKSHEKFGCSDNCPVSARLEICLQQSFLSTQIQRPCNKVKVFSLRQVSFRRRKTCTMMMLRSCNPEKWHLSTGAPAFDKSMSPLPLVLAF